MNARGFEVFHREGAVVDFVKACVEPAQQAQHLLLVGFFLLFVEPACLVVGVEFVIRRIEFRNLEVDFAKLLIVIYHDDAGVRPPRFDVACPDGPLKIVEHQFYHCHCLLPC